MYFTIGKYAVNHEPRYLSLVASQSRGQTLCRRVLQLLAAEREKRGVTKYALAQRSGVSPQMVGYIEKGERNPTFEIVCRLADALDVDLAKLIREAQRELTISK